MSSEPLYPPTPDDFVDGDDIQAIENPFGSGFGDDSSEVPLMPSDKPDDPMFSLDPGPSARPDWLLNTAGEDADKQPKKPPITVPVESVQRDQVLKELLGDDTDQLDDQVEDDSPAPFELSPDTILDESLEATSGDPYLELFQEFKTERQKCGLEVDHLVFDDFHQKVLKKEADFKSRHKCDAVILEVFVKDGRVGLKARPA